MSDVEVGLLMAAERRAQLDWSISTTLSPPLPCTPSHPGQLSLAIPSTAAASHDNIHAWSSSVAVQPEMLSATSHQHSGAGVWDERLCTGSGNSSLDGGAVTSRGVEGMACNDAANCEESPQTGGSYERRPGRLEVTSQTETGSERELEPPVFSDVDYQVLCRHVMQGDLDDHVHATADRKSLDHSRKLIDNRYTITVSYTHLTLPTKRIV